MKLIDRLAASARNEQRYSLSDYAALLGDDLTYSFNGVSYALTQTWPVGSKSEAAPRSLAELYTSNGVVFACVAFRQSVFSEARFQFQQIRDGRPGDLFGTEELALLEVPWPNGTTGDLLTRMSLDTDLAGNFFAVREPRRLRRLRPDWVEIALSAPADEYDAEPIGYLYHPGGVGFSKHTQVFTVEQVVHWAPKPDPGCSYRGMSPLTPVLREVNADSAMVVHKKAFLDNAATPNMVVKFDAATSLENFVKFKEQFQDDHQGARNAYKTLFLGGGADATVVGRDFKELDFSNTQGKGETRIAAAFEVPPVLVGLSEGLQAATYSNYASARRRYADGTERPRWRSAAAALASVLQVPSGSRLWYDDRDVAFLREDAKDDAEIQAKQASTIRQLVDAGYTADSVVAAVIAQDFSRLVHSKLFSVQLQPAGSQQATTT